MVEINTDKYIYAGNFSSKILCPYIYVTPENSIHVVTHNCIALMHCPTSRSGCVIY